MDHAELSDKKKMAGRIDLYKEQEIIQNTHLHVQINVEYTPPWILQLSKSLQQRKRARMKSVRSWAKVHLHHQLAVA